MRVQSTQAVSSLWAGNRGGVLFLTPCPERSDSLKNIAGSQKIWDTTSGWHLWRQSHTAQQGEHLLGGFRSASRDGKLRKTQQGDGAFTWIFSAPSPAHTSWRCGLDYSATELLASEAKKLKSSTRMEQGISVALGCSCSQCSK